MPETGQLRNITVAEVLEWLDDQPNEVENIESKKYLNRLENYISDQKASIIGQASDGLTRRPSTTDYDETNKRFDSHDSDINLTRTQLILRRIRGWMKI